MIPKAYALQVDKRFQRDPSPLSLGDLVRFPHADLFERLILSRLEALVTEGKPTSQLVRSGALLASAVLFGGLIDHRKWARWMFLAGRSHEFDQRLWIEIGGSDGFGRKRETHRWFADPFTEGLLLRWQTTYGTDREKLEDPEQALAAFFGVTGSDWERREQLPYALQAAAEIKWRLRMPGCLVDAVNSPRPMPAPTRQGSEHCQIPPPESQIGFLRGLPVGISQRRWGMIVRGIPHDHKLENIEQSHRSVVASPVSKGEAETAFVACLRSESSSETYDDRLAAAELLSIEEASGKWRPIEQLIFGWAASRVDSRLVTITGYREYKFSTIRRYAIELFRKLSTIIEEVEQEDLTASSLAEAYEEIYLYSNSDRDSWQKTYWTIVSFQSYVEITCPDLAVKISNGDFLPASVAADILSAPEFRHVQAKFSGSSEFDRTAKCLLSLGFWAGLRWAEAVELDWSDITVSQSAVELTIRTNSRRQLKTLASRRTLPLDALLPPSELEDLLRWRTARLFTNDVGSNASRLFPKKDDKSHLALKRSIQFAIRQACGNPIAVYHLLRHSCASYLFVTLGLPFDVANEALVPKLDEEVVSHARRTRLMPILVGQQRMGQNALHAVSSLLGHSGNRSTLRSYIHLHDWLVGQYVSRPSVHRGLSAPLAAWLCDMSTSAIIKADARRSAANRVEASFPAVTFGKYECPDAAPITRRQRGRQRRAQTMTGSIQLALLPAFSFGKQGRGSARVEPNSDSLGPGAGALLRPQVSWQTLLAMALAPARDLHVAGKAAGLDPDSTAMVVGALQKVFRAKTRGRTTQNQKVVRERYCYSGQTAESPLLQKPSRGEMGIMSRLWARIPSLSADDQSFISNAIVNHYDQPRGVVRLRTENSLRIYLKCLQSLLIPDSAISILNFPNSATIKVHFEGRASAGFRVAVLLLAVRLECEEATKNLGFRRG